MPSAITRDKIMRISIIKVTVALLVFALIGYRFIAAWTPVWLDTLVLLFTVALVAASIYVTRSKKEDPKKTDLQ